MTQVSTHEVVSAIDQRVILHGVSWSDYQHILSVRGESAGVRLTYLRGELELMTPSRDHEGRKTTLARLLEAWAEEHDVELNGFGSWTIKSEPKGRGVEPDECYIVGDDSGEKEAPDLAIEVIWTSGGIDKLEVYRGLGVGEVWFWRKGRIEVFLPRDDTYQAEPRSALFAELDLELLASYCDRPRQTRAVREYRARLREL